MARAACGLQRPAEPHAARSRGAHPRRLPRSRGRHRDHRQLQRQRPLAGRIRPGGARLRDMPRSRGRSPRRSRRLHGAHAPHAPLRRRLDGSHEPHALALVRRRFARGARRRVRRHGPRLPRAGPRPAGRRRRSAAARNLLRRPQRQGGDLRRRGALRRAGRTRSGHRVGHAHRVGPHARRTDRGGLLRLGGPRRTSTARSAPGPCCPTSNGSRPWPKRAWRSTPTPDCRT